eukprot:5930078-Prymnesium_polylepis.1
MLPRPPPSPLGAGSALRVALLRVRTPRGAAPAAAPAHSPLPMYSMIAAAVRRIAAARAAPPPCASRRSSCRRGAP